MTAGLATSNCIVTAEGRLHGTLCASTYDSVRSLTTISANRSVVVIPAANAKSSPTRQWRPAKIPPFAD
jgi:hypothetical protein